MTAAEAARAYVDAFTDPDPRGAQLLERCLHPDAALIAGGTRHDGRAAILAARVQFFADPRKPRARLTSPIDVQGRLFRFTSVAELPDGTSLGEFSDVGEVDTDGRIVRIYTMRGRLA